jgi:orotidine-5'-phosphate decarboxylase
MEKVQEWGTSKDTMFVVGATRPEVLRDARALAPDHFFLVPGVGAQGGDLQAVLEQGITSDGGLLINSSRGILYAGKDNDAIVMARRSTAALQRTMEQALVARGVI